MCRLGGMKRKGAGHIDREMDERKQENKNARILRIPFASCQKGHGAISMVTAGGGECRIIIGMKGRGGEERKRRRRQ